MGVRVRATSDDATIATATVTPNSKKKRPTMPWMKATGTKTATRVRVDAIAAKAISLVPRRAASRLGSPSSMWRWAFSRTMIASSTTTPIDRASASSVRLLMVKPKKYIAPKVASSDVGMVIAGMRALRGV